MKKRIAMIVYNEVDYDGRVQRAAIALSKKYHVTVVSIDSGRNYFNDNFSTKAIKLPDIKTYKVIRHLLFWLKVTPVIMQLKPHICYSHDFFVAFPGLIWSYLTQSKYIYDAHELIVPEKGKKQGKKETLFYFFEKISVKYANLVIAANKERSSIMKEHYSLKNTPLVIKNIPHIPKLFNEKIIHDYPLLKNKDKNEIWLVYQGDINLERGIKPFIMAMKHTGHRYKLLLIGGGPDLNQIKSFVIEKQLNDKILILGKIPRDHLHPILTICDIGLVTYPFQGLNNLFCASNKIFEYAQAGLSVLATCQPPLRSILEKYQFGILIGCNNQTILTESILDALFKLSKKKCFLKGIDMFLYENKWSAEANKLLSVTKKMVAY